MPANTAQKISSYQACTAPKAVDALMILSANTSNDAIAPFITKHSTVGELFSNVTIISTNTIVLKSHTTPSSNAANGLAVGTMWSDDSYVYVVCTTGIKRANLSTF